MDGASAISAGFRRAFRAPEIVLAEIAWRWAFGLAALALATATFFAYLDTLAVSNLEALALRSHRGWLVTDALGQILRGSGPHLVQAIAIIVPALSFLWIASAAVGRAATMKALLRREEQVAFRPQLGLSFLRAAVGLASLIGYLGALIEAGQAAQRGVEFRPGIFLLLFLSLALLITMARSRLSWFLSLAAVSAARENQDTFSAISSALGLFRRRARSFAVAGTVFAVIHGIAWVVATMVALLFLSLASKAPVGLIVTLILGMSLAYFAFCDFLHIARLAAYVALDESDRTPPVPVRAEPEPPPVPGFPPLGPEQPPSLPAPSLSGLEPTSS